MSSNQDQWLDGAQESLCHRWVKSVTSAAPNTRTMHREKASEIDAYFGCLRMHQLLWL
jgi:hypothetical protein